MSIIWSILPFPNNIKKKPKKPSYLTCHKALFTCVKKEVLVCRLSPNKNQLSISLSTPTHINVYLLTLPLTLFTLLSFFLSRSLSLSPSLLSFSLFFFSLPLSFLCFCLFFSFFFLHPSLFFLLLSIPFIFFFYFFQSISSLMYKLFAVGFFLLPTFAKWKSSSFRTTQIFFTWAAKLMLG